MLYTEQIEATLKILRGQLKATLNHIKYNQEQIDFIYGQFILKKITAQKYWDSVNSIREDLAHHLGGANCLKYCIDQQQELLEKSKRHDTGEKTTKVRSINDPDGN